MTEKKHQQSINSFPPGSCVRIVDFTGNPKLRGFLFSLGITPGANATVRKCGGPCCTLCVKGCDVALDGQVAESILATPNNS